MASGAFALAIAGGAFASPHNGHGQHLSSKPGYVVAKGGQHNLRFSSTTIERGKRLHIVDNSGTLHTLSLVIPKLVPETNKQVKKCNNSGHICRKIAKWHKFSSGHVGVKTSRAGKHGWDDMGSLHRNGDSVLLGAGQFPNNRKVTAPAGTVLHFICAIHPWMHGTITVTD